MKRRKSSATSSLMKAAGRIRRGRHKRSVAAKKAAKTRRKRTRTNFHSKGTLLGEHVAGIVYYHGATNYRGQWTHKFPKSKGVVRMYAMPNGELLLKGSKPLFEEHLVPDDT